MKMTPGKRTISVIARRLLHSAFLVYPDQQNFSSRVSLGILDQTEVRVMPDGTIKQPMVALKFPDSEQFLKDVWITREDDRVIAKISSEKESGFLFLRDNMLAVHPAHVPMAIRHSIVRQIDNGDKLAAEQIVRIGEILQNLTIKSSNLQNDIDPGVITFTINDSHADWQKFMREMKASD